MVDTPSAESRLGPAWSDALLQLQLSVTAASMMCTNRNLEAVTYGCSRSGGNAQAHVADEHGS